MPVAGAVHNGCTIASFQKKSFENVLGCAEVVGYFAPNETVNREALRTDPDLDAVRNRGIVSLHGVVFDILVQACPGPPM